ncbi:AraC family transcriptional regulator N-terminal domain-containing protein [Aliamphritea spongicola]|uniref:AraC family transcriptional regulator N-terminal domain-containing protein n=1 Tax=Aliamphritea spongicola TaxID=707589 RepID=UPI00196A38DE|nr:AraC family transcriptional regulator [Aliamphritea spongicola]
MQFDSELAASIGRFHQEDGICQTGLPGLVLYRSAKIMPRQPVVYNPSICVIAQGKKRVHFGTRECSYDPDNYLINSVTMPVEGEVVRAAEDKPYMGLSLRIDSYVISQLLIEMEQQDQQPEQLPSDEIILSSPATDKLQSSFIRLLECLPDEMDRKVLAPGLIREIYYEVLKGPHGDVLRNCVSNNAGANRIAPVVHYIEKNFHQPLDIDTIARFAGMSSSTLHEQFKQITSMTPMQFVKSLRLHRAHSLLLSGTQASEASYSVGYSSPSQFSREFKRFFGDSPREIQALRAG